MAEIGVSLRSAADDEFTTGAHGDPRGVGRRVLEPRLHEHLGTEQAANAVGDDGFWR